MYSKQSHLSLLRTKSDHLKFHGLKGPYIKRAFFKTQNFVLQSQLLKTFLQMLILNSKHCFLIVYTDTLLVCNYAICIKQLLCSPKS